MKRQDLPWIRQVILQSGVGTKTQRKAIAQRIEDAFMEASKFRGATSSDTSASIGSALDDAYRQQKDPT